MDKPWYTSVTIWGGIITALSAILGPIGYSIAPEDQQQLAGICAAAAAAVGSLVTIIGRVRKAPCPKE